MTAFDAAGQVVLVAPANVQWNSASAANVTVGTPGIAVAASGLVAGTSLVTVTETESGKSAQTTVTVTAGGGNGGGGSGTGEGIYVADPGTGRLVRIGDMSGAGWTTYRSPE
jgi:hypothetical protein